MVQGTTYLRTYYMLPNKLDKAYKAYLDSYYVVELVSGEYEVKRVGILDDDISGVYSTYQELPCFIKRALAVINMMAQTNKSAHKYIKVDGVGSMFDGKRYVVYPQKLLVSE